MIYVVLNKFPNSYVVFSRLRLVETLTFNFNRLDAQSQVMFAVWAVITKQVYSAGCMCSSHSLSVSKITSCRLICYAYHFLIHSIAVWKFKHIKSIPRQSNVLIFVSKYHGMDTWRVTHIWYDSLKHACSWASWFFFKLVWKTFSAQNELLNVAGVDT